MTLRSLIRLSLLVCSVVPTVIAQAQSSPEQSSTNQRHEERIRDLEAENSRLQQEVIRLRNATLQHQASLRLRDVVIERYAQQTDAMTTAQLKFIEQHKQLVSAVKTLQANPKEARRNSGFGDALTSIGLGMASSNATNVTDSLTDALTAYSSSLNSSSSSYLREVRALNAQRENRQVQQRMEFLLNDLSNSLNQIQFNNGYWWQKR